MPRINLRVLELQQRDWKEEAQTQELSLSAFVKQRVDAALGSPRQEDVLASIVVCLDEMREHLTQMAAPEFEY